MKQLASHQLSKENDVFVSLIPQTVDFEQQGCLNMDQNVALLFWQAILHTCFHDYFLHITAYGFRKNIQPIYKYIFYNQAG